MNQCLYYVIVHLLAIQILDKKLNKYIKLFIYNEHNKFTE
jgi:hypothetical protein